jgi:hypothetical protein
MDGSYCPVLGGLVAGCSWVQVFAGVAADACGEITTVVNAARANARKTFRPKARLVMVFLKANQLQSFEPGGVLITSRACDRPPSRRHWLDDEPRSTFPP